MTLPDWFSRRWNAPGRRGLARAFLSFPEVRPAGLVAFQPGAYRSWRTTAVAADDRKPAATG